MDPLNEKIVVITGASSGLGEATARLLADRGAKVVLAARRTDKLETIVSEIKAKGCDALAVATDVTRREDVDALIKAALDAHGRIDALVNNAGLMANAPLDALKVDEWDAMIDINIKGVLYGIAAALPVFRKQESGHFINIGSVVSQKVFAPNGVVYSGTKFAVWAISEGLRVEAGPKIRTTTIMPGAVDTELKDGTSHTETHEALSAFYGIAIDADSVARAVAYALEQPATVDINEITLRPTIQEF